MPATSGVAITHRNSCTTSLSFTTHDRKVLVARPRRGACRPYPSAPPYPRAHFLGHAPHCHRCQRRSSVLASRSVDKTGLAWHVTALMARSAGTSLVWRSAV